MQQCTELLIHNSKPNCTCLILVDHEGGDMIETRNWPSLHILSASDTDCGSTIPLLKADRLLLTSFLAALFCGTILGRLSLNVLNNYANALGAALTKDKSSARCQIFWPLQEAEAHAGPVSTPQKLRVHSNDFCGLQSPILVLKLGYNIQFYVVSDIRCAYPGQLGIQLCKLF